MRVLIAGCGAVGSLVAAYINDLCELHVLGRPWHLKKVRTRGLVLVKHNTRKIVRIAHVHTSAEDVARERFDVIIVTTKAHDTRQILRELTGNGVRAECWTLLQNGLGNEEIAREVLGERTNIVRGITNNGAHIPEPGVVVHAGEGPTFFGPVYGDEAERWAKELASLFNRAGLKAEVVSDIRRLAWEKAAVNAVINTVTAVMRVRNAAVVRSRELRELAERIVREVCSVAEACGVDLNAEEVLARVLAVAQATGDNVSSTLQDVLRRRRTEMDFICGYIVDKARELGLRVPTCEVMYLLVRAAEGISREYPELFVERG